VAASPWSTAPSLTTAAPALEYNVVAWGRTGSPPEAGIAVYVRGDSGKLAVARVYDDSDPPVSHHS
jgi:hypothetical protein